MAKHTAANEAPPDFESDDDFGEWFRQELAKKHGLETQPSPAPRKRGGKSASLNRALHWDRVRRVEEQIQADFPPTVRRRVEIVRMKQVNAFVVPGRFIYITTELMKRLRTDDAVAMILGHELAHAELGHLFEFRRRAAWKDVPAGDTVLILLHLAQRFVSSPENERDADAYGLDLALRAGYDGDKCLESFATLEEYFTEKGASFLVHGPEAAYRPTDDAFGEWKARAEVWLYEHATGYPALRERRIALADRLAQHRTGDGPPLLLPGSRRSIMDANAGFHARVAAIDEEMARWGEEMTALATGLADVLRLAVCRRLIAAVNGTTTGLDGRTAREAEDALSTLQEIMRQTTALLKMHERAKEVRRFLSGDNPPQSALAELQSLLFGGASPSAATTPHLIVAELVRRFESARATIAAIDAAWELWRPIVAAFSEDLRLLRQASSAMSFDQNGSIEDLSARLAGLQRQIDSDPLDVSSQTGRKLEAELAEARESMRARIAERRSLIVQQALSADGADGRR